MTKPAITVSAGDTLLKARNLMIKKGVSGLVVVDDGDRPMGIIDDTQIGLAIIGEETEMPLDLLYVGNFIRMEVTEAPIEMPVIEAAKTMRDLGISRLPIVNGIGRLAGVVTTQDVMGVYGRSSRITTRVEDVMDGEPSTVSPYNSIFYVINKMEASTSKRVIVVNVQKRPIGIITPIDIAAIWPRVHLKKRRRMLPRGVKGIYMKYAMPIAEDVMSSPVFAARRGELLINLAMRMYVEGIGAAPVIDEEGKLVGIVTRREILDDLARTESVEPAEHTD